ncbi:MAG: hypothetical protein HY738_00295 [Bacteroidia bacterium]|nr:hypothetical protein [Bacteroidia bacterium]
MKIKIYQTILIIFLSADLSAQFFFIPIFVPNTSNNTYVRYNCPTRNMVAHQYFENGIEYYDKNIDLSIGSFKEAIENDSLFCDAYDYLAFCFNKNNQLDSALKYIDASLKVNSSNYDAIRTKGFFYMDNKDYNMAARHFYQQHLKQPNEGEWLYYIIRSLIELNLMDSAYNTTKKMEIAYNKQGNENSKDLSLFLQGIIASLKGDYSNAKQMFSSIEESYEWNKEFCYYFGLCHLNGENPKIRKAKKYIRRARKLGYDVEQSVIDKLKK